MKNWNLPASRTQACSRCGKMRRVHSWHGASCAPVCAACASILVFVQKFIFANAHPEVRVEAQ